MSALTFVPLGGSGEIGMNFNAYGHDGEWLIVDCGAGFERLSTTEQRVILPDPGFLAARPDAIVGLVLTHVHLDHLGAVAELWPRLKCPVWCTPFAAALLRPRLKEWDLEGKVPLHEVAPGTRWSVGSFHLESVALTHSTVEMVGLSIRAGETHVFHTGDFKLDDRPGTGPVSDRRTLRRLGDSGVDVVVSDSTNATKSGRSRAEGEVHDALATLLAGRGGRIAVGVFASNVARMEALARLAVDLDRHPIFVGRSMGRTVLAGLSVGYFGELPSLVPEPQVGWLPPEHVLLVCTGTQAEPGAALVRMADDTHPFVKLDRGDTVIFSSKIIPGNEEPIAKLHAAFRARGIEVISEVEHPAVHASGHPSQGELAELYELLRPGTVVPVHGEPRHLEAHAAFARTLGLRAYEVRNGDALHLGPGPVSRVGRVPSGSFPRDALRVEPRPARPTPRHRRHPPEVW